MKIRTLSHDESKNILMMLDCLHNLLSNVQVFYNNKLEKAKKNYQVAYRSNIIGKLIREPNPTIFIDSYGNFRGDGFTTPISHLKKITPLSDYEKSVFITEKKIDDFFKSNDGFFVFYQMYKKYAVEPFELDKNDIKQLMTLYSLYKELYDNLNSTDYKPEFENKVKPI